MAGKRSRSKQKHWLDQRAIVLSEAVLAAGLLQELLEAWILSLTAVPPLLRILGAVAVVVGILGGTMLVLRKRLAEWIKGTHDTLTTRLPLPSLAAHAVILLALFGGYCWLWNDETGALDALWAALPGASG